MIGARADVAGREFNAVTTCWARAGEGALLLQLTLGTLLQGTDSDAADALSLHGCSPLNLSN